MSRSFIAVSSASIAADEFPDGTDGGGGGGGGGGAVGGDDEVARTTCVMDALPSTKSGSAAVSSW